MIDDLDGNFACFRGVKRAAFGGIEHGPGGFVDLSTEGALELFVGLIGTGEIGVADEEAFTVVVGVDEPSGDVVGGVTPNLAGGRVVNVEAFDFDAELAVFGFFDFDIRLPKDHEEITGAGLL